MEAYLRPLWVHTHSLQWPLPHPQTPSPINPVYKVNRIWEGTPWTLCGTLNSESTLNPQPSRASHCYTYYQGGSLLRVLCRYSSVDAPIGDATNNLCLYTLHLEVSRALETPGIG